jgi:tetratricopeptide (TPR) repeat protein
MYYGLVSYYQSKLSVSIDYYHQSAAIFEMLKHHTLHSRVLFNLASALSSDLRFEQAEVISKKSLQLAKQQGDKKAIADAMLGIGNILYHLKKLDEAEYYFLGTLEALETIDSPYAMTSCLQLLARVYNLQGKYTEAKASFRRGIPIASTAQDHESAVYMWTGSCETLIAEKNFAEAKESLYHAIVPARQSAVIVQLYAFRNAIQIYIDTKTHLDFAVRLHAIRQANAFQKNTQKENDVVNDVLKPLVSESDFDRWQQQGLEISAEEGLNQLEKILLSEP